VINHMVGGGNDANPYHRNPDANCAEWGAKNSSLGLHYEEMNSTAFDGPSPMFTQSYVYTEGDYTGKPPVRSSPRLIWALLISIVNNLSMRGRTATC